MLVSEMKLEEIYRFSGMLYMTCEEEFEYIKWDGVNSNDKINTVFKNMFRIFTTKEEALERIKSWKDHCEGG